MGSTLHSITQKGVTAHPSFLIVTLICLPTIAALVPCTSKPLLWLGHGLWAPKPLNQQQACLSEMFPTISNTDPMVIAIVHCLIDLTWWNGKVLDLVYRQYNTRSSWTMLKAYLKVIHTLLILTDTCGYHAQLSMVTSNIDMISVIFIRGKLLKLHASVSIHTTGISPARLWWTLTRQ